MVGVQALRGLAFDWIGHRLRAVTGSRASLDTFASPPGDPGLFGPDSVVWRVHAHFTAMMVGGLSSLMVQALHPRALAAVWDHSDFRSDLRGRLGRTAYFVAVTTYGGREQAMRAIARVNAIHAGAVGVDQQGQPYAADDPHLIRWVHLVEVISFLNAFQHLAARPLNATDADRYIAEMVQVGHALGAVDLPRTLQQTELALRGLQPELTLDARVRDILRVIQSYPVEGLDRPFMALVMQAAFDVMPDWALHLIARPRSCPIQRQAVRRALQLGSAPVQWMLDQQGVAATARQRVCGPA